MSKTQEEKKEEIIKTWRETDYPSFQSFGDKFKIDPRTIRKIIIKEGLGYDTSHNNIRTRKLLAYIKELQSSMCRWEEMRAQRLSLEEHFKDFNGHIDIIEMHVPYTKFKYVYQLMKEASTRKGKKMLVCAGDSMNLDMFSPFYQKSGDRSKPSDEWKTLLTVLRGAECIYDKIIFMETNHDNRIFKVIRNNILGRDRAEEAMKWMKTYQDAFEKEKFKKIITVKGAIFQIGDVLITHFENNSVVPGHIPRDVIKYLVPRMQKHWNIVFQAHTHSHSKIPNDRKIAIETGALCKTLDYWRRGKMQGKGKLTSLGYAVCEMRKGIADPNDSNFIFYEWEDWL